MGPVRNLCYAIHPSTNGGQHLNTYLPNARGQNFPFPPPVYQDDEKTTVAPFKVL